MEIINKNFNSIGSCIRTKNAPKGGIAGIYAIKCESCPKIYIGESDDCGRRAREHLRDVNNHKLNSPLVEHSNNFNPAHSVNPTSFNMFYNCNNVANRKFLESFLINKYTNFNRDKGNCNFDAVLLNILKDNSRLVSCDKKLKSVIDQWSVP